MHGKDTAVVLSCPLADYWQLQAEREPLGTFLMRTAPRDLDIDPEPFERVPEIDRPVDL